MVVEACAKSPCTAVCTISANIIPDSSARQRGSSVFLVAGIMRRVPAPRPAGSRWSCKFAPGKFVERRVRIKSALSATHKKSPLTGLDKMRFFSMLPGLYRDYSARPCALPCGLASLMQICSRQICRTRECSHPLSPPSIKKAPMRG